ncbi:DNA gyrase inhibitor YacG [Pseudoalteromonas sp. T1lg48]|uniref:DNA gyrase inhibitor YacG n=1 Tax=Pseudoalteromonas sp. T1lg48 TaxID=2077100 RepID=UPI000CF6F8B9|nr:DNA gyrase inhibitor YacG [Pseudoalteromonas sp. T1lg48]
MPAKVNCPTCQNEVTWGDQSPYRPFCSKRCQLIDLGEWSSESNTISTPMSNELQGADADAFIEEVEAMLAKSGESFFKE